MATASGSAPRSNRSAALVPRQYILPFILLTICFPAWGLANNMTDPLVKGFQQIFTIPTTWAALVQFWFYGAYFCLALPAAFIIKRFSYKTGVLVGLGLFAIGALMFYPASVAMQYSYFLVAIFVLAGGLSILETSCNPYIIALGPEETATRRLNLAQSFNPVGSVIGMMMAGFLILPKLNVASEETRNMLKATDPDKLREMQSGELAAVMGPYVGTALALVVLWLLIAIVRMPRASDADTRIDFFATLGRLVRNRHYSFGVIAQFFYVAAQICVWTFTIHYISSIVDRGDGQPLRDLLERTGIGDFVRTIRLVDPTKELNGITIAGIYHTCAMLLFLGSRFVCTALMHFMRPSMMLAGLGAGAIGLCAVAIVSSNLTGALCIIGISGCMSLMFPTIYGIALHGLGEDAKFGGAGLVMGILGGSLFPMLQAFVIDSYVDAKTGNATIEALDKAALTSQGAALSFAIPLVCFVVVTAYGLFDLKANRVAHGS
jgi:FHS family L-fucose permease-like MFS transporter